MTAEPTTSRAEVFRAVKEGIDRGLPAPKAVRFRADAVSIDLDSIADLDLWAEHLAPEPWYRDGQPHPDLTNPANSDRWIVSSWRPWNGWQLTLEADDPITDEQRQQWIDSGHAARHQTDAGEQA